MTNGFLVSVPHEGLHGAISILEQRPELPTNMCKAWAVKDVVPLIAYCMCIAQCAPAQLPGDHWPDKPALLNRQGMGAHSKLHQQPREGVLIPYEAHTQQWECHGSAESQASGVTARTHVVADAHLTARIQPSVIQQPTDESRRAGDEMRLGSPMYNV